MNQPKKERFKTSVGGQALMEGIMMRGPKQMCCAVRKPDGTIETKLDPTPTHGVWTKIPLVRGAISMIESMIVGYRYMMYSAQVSMGDDYDPAEEETAFEKWVGEHLGEKAENALLTVAAVLGIPAFVLGVGDFNRDAWNNFINTTIMPLARNMEQELTKKLLYSPGWFFRFNSWSLFSYSINELVSAGAEMVDRMALRRNEWRGWVNLPPDPEMNQLLALENYIPVEKLGDQNKLNGGE